MKSYLRFLSRNKLYTTIEVVGLSVSLAFVIVFGSYIVNDLKCDSSIKNVKEVHILRNKAGLNEFFVRHDFTETMVSGIPDIKSISSIVFEDENFGGETLSAEYEGNECFFNCLIGADPNFFSFFSFPLEASDKNAVLNNNKGAVISRDLADRIFGNESPIGKSIVIPFSPHNPGGRIEFTVNGIFEEFPNTSLPKADVIINREAYYTACSVVWRNRQFWQRDPRIMFVRINPDCDKELVSEQLNELMNGVAGRGKYYDIRLVSISDYHRKEGYDSRAEGRFRNTDIYSIYMTICFMLSILALLNYILLTVAYSHFRIKEISIRQLLGTSRRCIVLRCSLETILLMVVSTVFAVMIAVGFEDSFSRLLQVDLHPMRNFTELIILPATAVIMALLAGMIASFITSRYNPIDIIKGQNRKHEKTTLSKLIIGTEGCLAIASTIILFVITKQNAYMMDYPMGYEKDNLIYVDFKAHGPRYIEKLQALPCVEDVGLISCLPMCRYHVIFPDGGNDIGMIVGERHTFELLGISINNYGNDAVPDEYNELYLSEETMDAIPGAIDDRKWIRMDDIDKKKEIYGTCSHFMIGTVKNHYNNLCAASIIPEWRAKRESDMHNFLVKVNGNEIESCSRITELYNELGYDDMMISVKSLNDYLMDDIAKERNLKNIILSFVLISLFLTGLAILAFSNYHAQLRTHDTAVKKVFGASRSSIFRKTVFGFMIPVLASSVIAIPAAYLITERWLEDYQYRIDNSWEIYALSLLLVMLIVFLSVIIHTIRLMRTNPAEALKKE